MRILVTNDGGIYSPGIAALARVAAAFGEVRVVAPDVEQSSARHAITATRPVRFRRTTVSDEIEAYLESTGSIGRWRDLFWSAWRLEWKSGGYFHGGRQALARGCCYVVVARWASSSTSGR
jgi:hypothetical protein